MRYYNSFAVALIAATCFFVIPSLSGTNIYPGASVLLENATYGAHSLGESLISIQKLHSSSKALDTEDLNANAASMPSQNNGVAPAATEGNRAGQIFKPAKSAGKNLPVVVYFYENAAHQPDASFGIPNSLAEKAEALVIAIPADVELEQARQAYRSALDHAEAWGGDTSRIAVMSETHDLDVAEYARQHNLQIPVSEIVLVESPTARVQAGTAEESASHFLVETAFQTHEVVSDNALAQVTPVSSATDTISNHDGNKSLRPENINVVFKSYQSHINQFFEISAAVADKATAQDLVAVQLKRAFTQ